MAVIFNKRLHNLVVGDTTLAPGENTVDDALWGKLNTKGSQVESWLRLNWLGEKRSLPLAKGEQPKQTGSAKGGAVFAAPTVDGPVSEAGGGPAGGPASKAGNDETVVREGGPAVIPDGSNHPRRGR
ncbi:MAG TPA: hypothetical protein VGO53_16115 [Steroidobacteraceae bacterium]|jgi:hypothetical protein|nr:hypothetical protein [Steroidobacteraceae bacterium]